MEMGKILSADVLDIIFDQRNKEYGAYDLRKNYQRRLTKALLVTALVVVLICLTYILFGSMKLRTGELVDTKVIELEQVHPKEQPVEKIIPPPVKSPPPPEIRMIRNTPPIIVSGEVPEDERPPLNVDLDNAKIGLVNTQGTDDMSVVTPPVNERSGVVTAPVKQQDDEDKIWTTVQIESTYPGGMSAWGRFLYQKMVYPQDAIDIRKEGTVNVRFVVGTDGHVSDVEAVSGPEELRAAAVSVIKKSIYWEPAIQNGRKVKSYKTQPITFKLGDDQ